MINCVLRPRSSAACATDIVCGYEQGLPSLPHGLHGCRSRRLHGTALHGCLLPHDLHGRCCSRCLHGTALHCCLLPHNLHGRCRSRCLHGTALHCCLLPHDLHGWCRSRLHGTALHRCLLLHDLHGLHCLHGLRHCWERKRFWIMKEQTL